MPISSRFWRYKWIIAPAGLFLCGLLAHSIYRDLQLEKQYASDLRNRVLGARLQKDGRLPYFYRWNPEDGTRFLDPDGCHQTPGAASRITASPFFHQLLYPLCDLPQRTIARMWFCLQYIMLAVMTLIFCGLTADPLKKMACVAAVVLFTATEAWKLLILEGQLYFTVAFIISLVISAMLGNKRILTMLAGVLAIVFILIRPIGLAVFIPFLFQYKTYSLFLVSAFLAFALYGLFAISNSFERALWKDYAHALRAHTEYHQEDPVKINSEPCPPFQYLEGYVYKEIQANFAEHPIHVYTEFGNVFILYNKLTNRKMPLWAMNFLCAATLIILSLFYYCYFRNGKPSLMQVLIFGFTLYMIVEMFSPVRRNQYNTVQWFPLVLAGILAVSRWKTTAFLLLAAGILLNILNTPWILMRHTLGECCWMAGLLLIAFSGKKYKIR